MNSEHTKCTLTVQVEFIVIALHGCDTNYRFILSAKTSQRQRQNFTISFENKQNDANVDYFRERW